MQTIGIEGKFLNLVKSVYNNIKSCVQCNNEVSNYFPCNNGVRHEENLSPLLFSIFFNDIESHLLNKDCNVVNLTKYTEDEKCGLSKTLKF